MTDLTTNRVETLPRAGQIERVAKLCGADAELGNFILGSRSEGISAPAACRLLLRQIDGYPRNTRPLKLCNCAQCRAAREAASRTVATTIDTASEAPPVVTGYDPRDWGRKYLCSGGCAYIDSNHLEICVPEVLSAYDHTACWFAMLRVVRRAQQAANDRLRGDQQLQVLVNNSDGRGNSYGSHLDFLITRTAWDNLFYRKVQQMLCLAAYQVSSIVITGQGKVGAENGAPPVPYQISQRADFFEMLTGPQTMERRPLVNSRDEALCGRPARAVDEWRAADLLARLHVIFYDSNLCPAAHLLKVGVLQVILAMVEVGRLPLDLMLDDPLEALSSWSHDPSLKATARMASGRAVTAVTMQRLFWEAATRFVEEGGCDDIVPRAGEILAFWSDTLNKLEANDLPALARRLDWVLKLRVLLHAMRRRPELDWQSPELKQLDHLYASLDPSQGLFWAYQRNGLVETVVDEGAIERFTREPPEDTRAWTRGKLLEMAGADSVEDVDWDEIRFALPGRGGRRCYRSLELDNPLAWTKAEVEPVLQADLSLAETLDRLGAPPIVEPAVPAPMPAWMFNASSIDAAANGVNWNSSPASEDDREMFVDTQTQAGGNPYDIA